MSQMTVGARESAKPYSNSSSTNLSRTESGHYKPVCFRKTPQVSRFIGNVDSVKSVFANTSAGCIAFGATPCFWNDAASCLAPNDLSKLLLFLGKNRIEEWAFLGFNRLEQKELRSC